MLVNPSAGTSTALAKRPRPRNREIDIHFVLKLDLFLPALVLRTGLANNQLLPNRSGILGNIYQRRPFFIIKSEITNSSAKRQAHYDFYSPRN
jgi:hypothetical protein